MQFMFCKFNAWWIKQTILSSLQLFPTFTFPVFIFMSVCWGHIKVHLREKKVLEWQWDKRVDWLLRPLPQFTPVLLRSTVSGSTTHCTHRITTVWHCRPCLKIQLQTNSETICQLPEHCFGCLCITFNMHIMSSISPYFVPLCVAVLANICKY